MKLRKNGGAAAEAACGKSEISSADIIDVDIENSSPSPDKTTLYVLETEPEVIRVKVQRYINMPPELAEFLIRHIPVRYLSELDRLLSGCLPPDRDTLRGIMDSAEESRRRSKCMSRAVSNTVDSGNDRGGRK